MWSGQWQDWCSCVQVQSPSHPLWHDRDSQTVTLLRQISHTSGTLGFELVSHCVPQADRRSRNSNGSSVEGGRWGHVWRIEKRTVGETEKESCLRLETPPIPIWSMWWNCGTIAETNTVIPPWPKDKTQQDTGTCLRWLTRTCSFLSLKVDSGRPCR